MILTQYPLLGINRFFKLYVKLLKLKKCTIACLIHDIDSLRYNQPLRFNGENKVFNVYDIIISHNQAMSQWLVENGYPGKIVEITLFDFLTTFQGGINEALPQEPRIIYAGNLARCAFLEDIHCITNVKFNLYGPGVSERVKSLQHSGVKWYGSFPINEILDKLEGDYGLIWDGPSIHECTGNMGNYLRYNTPHKLSLYLSAGVPVIIADSAAMAAFVREKNIGIAVSSLDELSSVLERITPADYKAMKQNAIALGNEVKTGRYLTNALAGVEKIWRAYETAD